MAHNMLRFYTDNVILRNTLQVSVDWKRTGVYTAEHGLINTLEAGTGAAAAIMELLLQSWDAKIRIFPCMLETWSEASFSTLRAEGAFLVSADFRDGAVQWIQIISEAGNCCVVVNPWEGGAVLRGELDGSAVELDGAELSFATEKGGQYELRPAGAIRGNPDRAERDKRRFSGLPRWD